ncbi:hypothetical protein BS50DRAFT_579531, partial [Corynespora cassiicola Philippines]
SKYVRKVNGKEGGRKKKNLAESSRSYYPPNRPTASLHSLTFHHRCPRPDSLAARNPHRASETRSPAQRSGNAP